MGFSGAPRDSGSLLSFTPLFDKIECANLAAKTSMENTDVQVIPIQ